MASTLIQGLSYYKIDSADLSSVSLNPTDNNGNIFPVVTLEFDTTFDTSYLALPIISSSNVIGNEPTLYDNLGFVLKVINTGTKDLQIETINTDQIGSTTIVTLTSQFSCAILTPINLTTWSIEVTN